MSTSFSTSDENSHQIRTYSQEELSALIRQIGEKINGKTICYVRTISESSEGTTSVQYLRAQAVKSFGLGFKIEMTGPDGRDLSLQVGPEMFFSSGADREHVSFVFGYIDFDTHVSYTIILPFS
jgi:hypothetical protein